MACAPAVLFGNSLDYTSVTCAQHTVASMLGLWLQLRFPCAAFFQGTNFISDLHTVFVFVFCNQSPAAPWQLPCRSVLQAVKAASLLWLLLRLCPNCCTAQQCALPGCSGKCSAWWWLVWCFGSPLAPRFRAVLCCSMLQWVVVGLVVVVWTWICCGRPLSCCKACDQPRPNSFLNFANPSLVCTLHTTCHLHVDRGNDLKLGYDAHVTYVTNK